MILPAAYYECVIQDIRETLEGVVCDGQRITPSPSAQCMAFLFRQNLYDIKSAKTNFTEKLSKRRIDLSWVNGGKYEDGGLEIAIRLEADHYHKPGFNVLQRMVIGSDDEPYRWDICDKREGALSTLR